MEHIHDYLVSFTLGSFAGIVRFIGSSVNKGEKIFLQCKKWRGLFVLRVFLSGGMGVLGYFVGSMVKEKLWNSSYTVPFTTFIFGMLAVEIARTFDKKGQNLVDNQFDKIGKSL